MHYSTKIIELGSCAFRQPKAKSHCKYLHGYRLTAKFWFAAKELDENNWVVDFGSLKALKQELQDWYDHTTCISYTDPHVESFKQLAANGVCDLRLMQGVGIEKFAEHCHHVASTHILNLTQNRCVCTKVEVFEHENNSAIFEVPAATLLGQEAPEAAPKEQVSAEQEAEDIATAADAKKNLTQPPFNKSSVTKPTKQSKKTSNNWIDPEFKGKTTNTWRF